jgi:hypothetical protein
MFASVAPGRLAEGMKGCTTYAFARSDGSRKKGVRAQNQGLARVKKANVRAGGVQRRENRARSKGTK